MSDRYLQWSHLGWAAAGKPPYNREAPNLQQLRYYLVDTVGGQPVGIYGVRPVRGGASPSTHAYGAALDWRYQNVSNTDKWHDVANPLAVIEWLIANYAVLGVQMIVDYVRCRVWKADRLAWKQQTPSTHGMGQRWAQWLHIETTPKDYDNSISVALRPGLTPLGAPPAPAPAPRPTPAPTPGGTMLIAVDLPRLARGAEGLDVARLQGLILANDGPNVAVDGKFGATTDAAVRAIQAERKLTVDGLVGPQTWRSLLDAEGDTAGTAPVPA